MPRSRPVIAGIVIGAALALPLGIHLGGGGRLILMQRSPDAREQIEFYSPARWQQRYVDNADMPAFARLVPLDGTTVVHDSDVFDLSGEGRVFWARDAVQIGTSAVYDRKTARWTIIQE